jgi:hypothetical protein
VADSKQTLLCTYLSAVLLIGLVLNSALGWWWADAGAALIIAGIAVREGINAWRGEACCAVPHIGGGAEEQDECCAPAAVTGAASVTPVTEQATPSDTAPHGSCCAGYETDTEPAPVAVALGTKPADQ